MINELKSLDTTKEETVMDSTTQSTQSKINWHLQEAGKLMFQSTDQGNLKDFEKIELEVRDQIIERVFPVIGEIFFLKVENISKGSNVE